WLRLWRSCSSQRPSSVDCNWAWRRETAGAGRWMSQLDSRPMSRWGRSRGTCQRRPWPSIISRYSMGPLRQGKREASVPLDEMNLRRAIMPGKVIGGNAKWAAAVSATSGSITHGTAVLPVLGAAVKHPGFRVNQDRLVAAPVGRGPDHVMPSTEQLL